MLSSIVLTAAALAQPQPLHQSVSEPDPPSFVVVLLDDVGVDKVALYGESPFPANTPALERLAACGMTFRNAWSMATCSPTRASLLTGRYPERNGIGTVIRPSDDVETPLSRDQITIPGALPGHTSVALGKWHLNDSGDIAVQSRLMGFDAFVGWSSVNDYFSWTENINGVLTAKAGYFPAALARYAKRTVDRLERPYFVYYCPFLAHSPFHTPPAELHPNSAPGTSRFDQHRQMVESIDTLLGRVLESVDLSNTYLFVLSDNGSPNPCVRPPFFPGKVKGSLYEGSVHVPFFAAGPGITPGSECERLVQVTDLMATILELAGAPAPAGFGEDSISFAHLLADPTRDHDRTFLYAATFGFPGSNHTVQHRRAIRTERYKLIDFVDDGRQELYDLSVDPFENMDRLVFNSAPAHLQIRDRLLAMMPTFP